MFRVWPCFFLSLFVQAPLARGAYRLPYNHTQLAQQLASLPDSTALGGEEGVGGFCLLVCLGRLGTVTVRFCLFSIRYCCRYGRNHKRQNKPFLSFPCVQLRYPGLLSRKRWEG